MLRALLFVLLSVAMAQGGNLKRPDAPPLAARGSFAVGVQTLQLSDPARSRTLTLEVWYPAQGNDEATVYNSTIGATPVKIAGRAKRGAPARSGSFPLVVASHGQPGTRYQFAFLSEHLASYGLVVANLDHPGSTYSDLTQANYISSIVDRPLDLLFVMNELPKRLAYANGNQVGLMGYSYGGYSAINAAGAGLDRSALESYCRSSGNEGPCFALPFFAQLEPARGRTAAQADPRIKAVLALSPYGAPWIGAASLANLKVPLMVAAGEADDVAVFKRDAEVYFKQAGSRAKYLLSLQAAQHNPFVECPAEVRSSATDYDRCWEPVWDQERSHDLIRHFAAAFFGTFLQNQSERSRWLDPKLPGFMARSTVGVRLQQGP